MTFSRAGFSLTTRKVHLLAFQYAELNNITGFGKRTKHAGKKWLHFFFKRHSEVRVKKAHNLSVNRAMCANPAVINKFFDQYQSDLQRLNITDPNQIWNVDESGCQDVPKEELVVGETGIPASAIVGKEQGETSTVLTFVSADGSCVPPMVIHKGEKIMESWLADKPVGVTLRTSETGWINKPLFLKYATRWVCWLKSWRYLNRPHILLLDAHKSHVYNIRFIKLMEEFNIHVLAIPAHTSHLTQPLDKTPFATLKSAWNEYLTNYLFEHAGCGMPKMDFFSVFWPAWKCAMDSKQHQIWIQVHWYIPSQSHSDKSSPTWSQSGNR